MKQLWGIYGTDGYLRRSWEIEIPETPGRHTITLPESIRVEPGETLACLSTV